MDKSTKDLMAFEHIAANEDEERGINDEFDSSEDMEPQPIGSGCRRNSLMDQFRDFLNRKMDFSFKIGNPFEKEMY